MCGIAGTVGHGTAGSGCLTLMTEALIHRGPDEGGIFHSEVEGVGLGMRRLAVVDLTGGHQPMSHDGVTLVFNGEIYNHAALREELRASGATFVTDHSDTEVVLRGYVVWGKDVFARLNGMFAVALWDARSAEMVLARDRFGKKPLYVGSLETGGIGFASEIKSLAACGHLSGEIDVEAAKQYLAYDYCLTPRSIYKSVSKFPPGHVGTVSIEAGVVSRPYWTPKFAQSAQPVASAVEELDRLLGEAVATRMIADVPVGLFLSGGLDSTTVGYYMRRHSDRVESFSIGFENKRFDESDYARAAAKHLGTKHNLEIISDRQLQDLVASLPRVLDEPMGDQSILPTLLLSRFARAHVTVALGGDGSDEIFMGYKAFRALKLGWLLDALPSAANRGLASLATSHPGVFRPLHPSAGRFLSRMGNPSTARLLAHLGSFDGDARSVLKPELAQAVSTLLSDARGLTADVATLPPHQEATWAYIRGYLLEDILVKVDRASMAASLEVRAPFLDPAVVDYALALPQNLKLRGLTGKYVLRELMRERIPSELIGRRKQGFGVPISEWLRGPLRELVQDHLSQASLTGHEMLDPVAVDKLAAEHLRGDRDHGNKLWVLLQFELWRKYWGAGSGPVRQVSNLPLERT